jgi:hypothetical protein
MTRALPMIFALLAVTGSYWAQQPMPSVPAGPAPLPEAVVTTDVAVVPEPAIPGTSSEVQVQVAAPAPVYVDPAQCPPAVAEGDACEPAVGSVYVEAAPGTVVVQAGPIRTWLAKKPVRTFWRGVWSRFTARVQARRQARAARFAGSDACSPAGW